MNFLIRLKNQLKNQSLKINNRFNLISFLKKIIVPIIFLLVWQILTINNSNTLTILPSPIKVLSATINLFLNESVVFDIIVSLKHVLIGFGFASIIGITVGISLGYSKIIKEYFGSLLEFFRPIPPIAWIPLSILWFGIGDKPAYFLVFLGSFFPIMTQTYFGVISINENQIRAALSLGANRKQLITDIILPASLYSVFSGLKTGLGIGWFMVITAELVGSQSGLGYLIQLNRLLLKTDNVIALMIIIGILGYIINKIMKYFEFKLIPWQKN